ncbi:MULTISPECIES: hypothetical protein [unclassified Microbacterium]|uniref:hypothetical protein n=1 Tax=unclassified Microbacterium TaxID=2609290 RepID=UPI003658D9E2
MPDTDGIGLQSITIPTDTLPPAVPAREHVAAPAPIPPMVRRSRWPLAPWRVVIAGSAVAAGVPVGIVAAAPGWNGADLAALIVLAAFVAAVIPGRN